MLRATKGSIKYKECFTKPSDPAIGKGAGVVKEGFPEEVTVKQRQNTLLAAIQQSM